MAVDDGLQCISADSFYTGVVVKVETIKILCAYIFGRFVSETVPLKKNSHRLKVVFANLQWFNILLCCGDVEMHSRVCQYTATSLLV